MTVRPEYLQQLQALSDEYQDLFQAMQAPAAPSTMEGFLPPEQAPRPPRTMDDVQREIMVDYRLGRAGDVSTVAPRREPEMRAYTPSVGERVSGAVQDAIGGDMGRRVSAPVGPIVNAGNAVKNLAVHASGVPLAMEAGGNLARAETPAGVGAAAVQGVLAVSPFTRTGRAITSTLPGMAGTSAAAFGAGLVSAKEAQAEPRGQTAPQSGPSLPGLSPEQMAIYNEARRRLQAGSFSSGADRRALEGTVRRLEDLSADAAKTANTDAAKRKARLEQEADTEAARIKSANTPFRDANPAATQALAAAGIATSLGLGYRGQAVANRARNEAVEAAAAVRDRGISWAERAYSRGEINPTIRGIDVARKAQDELNAFTAAGAPKNAMPLPLGLASAEAGIAAPELMDYVTAPATGQLRENTKAQLADWQYWLPRLALGGMTGYAGHKIGSALATARTPVPGVPSRDAEINAFREQPQFRGDSALINARGDLKAEKADSIARAMHRAEMRELELRGRASASPDRATRLPPDQTESKRLPPPQAGSGGRPAGGPDGPPQTPPPGPPSGGRTDQGPAAREPQPPAGGASANSTSSAPARYHWEAQPRTESGQFDGPPDPKKWRPRGGE